MAWRATGQLCASRLYLLDRGGTIGVPLDDNMIASDDPITCTLLELEAAAQEGGHDLTRLEFYIICPTSRPANQAPVTHDELSPSGRKTLERTPELTLTQTLESAITELTNSLPRDPEHIPDLLEGVLMATLEPEVEAEYPCIPRHQRIERSLDLLCHQTLLYCGLGLRGLSKDEALDARPIITIPARRVARFILNHASEPDAAAEEIRRAHV